MNARYIISISHIPWTVSHLELERYFSAFGTIKFAKVIFNKYGLSTGYGFVEFYSKFAMLDALCVPHFLDKQRLLLGEGIQLLQEANISHESYIWKSYLNNITSN